MLTFSLQVLCNRPFGLCNENHFIEIKINFISPQSGSPANNGVLCRPTEIPFALLMLCDFSIPVIFCFRIRFAILFHSFHMNVRNSHKF